jgi:hypothetical protein
MQIGNGGIGSVWHDFCSVTGSQTGFKSVSRRCVQLSQGIPRRRQSLNLSNWVIL